MCDEDDCTKNPLKGQKLYVAFMDMEKVYEKGEWNSLWNVLMVYRIGKHLLDGV